MKSVSSIVGSPIETHLKCGKLRVYEYIKYAYNKLNVLHLLSSFFIHGYSTSSMIETIV